MPAADTPVPDSLRRTIRSFVRRAGRVTAAQQRALDALWPRYGIEPQGLLDWADCFARRAPVILEIGFGNGEATASMAAQDPGRDYLAVDVHRPGVGALLIRAEGLGLSNLRIACMDAKELLQYHIKDASLQALYLFFPDPWPKKRHHKRRLLQAEFVELVTAKLEVGGRLHMATDWQDYAETSLAILEQASGLINVAAKGQYSARPSYRPETKFERRGQRLGHGVWDLIYERCT